MFYEDARRDAIYKYVDDERTELLGVDGGEPEAQTFSRDWGWVCDELNAAYRAGFANGAHEASKAIAAPAMAAVP